MAKFASEHKLAKGRIKGSKNKATIQRERAKALEIIAGLQPLQFMVDGKLSKDRVDSVPKLSGDY